MSLTFDKVAKSIIQNSIQSAIYIDDKLIVPFEKTSNIGAQKLSSGLYHSFRSHNIGLDFYKYKTGINWKDYKKLLFKSRDLIILDWELDEHAQQKNTLEILTEAVLTPSLHFICIYTLTDKGSFPSILYSIRGYFSEFDNDIYAKINPIIEEYNGEGEYLTMEFLNSVKGLFKEFAIYSKKADELFAQIEQEFKAHFGDEFVEFQEKLRSISPNLRKAYEAFGYVINKEVLKAAPSPVIDIKIYPESNFILLNHTIIHLSNKSEQKPGQLYTYFSNAVIGSTNNFLTLMSLEIKNLFRDGSGFMGKEIDSIEEAAFFYHKDQLPPSDSFYDFLIDLWKGQSMGFLYQKNNALEILDEAVLTGYRKKRNINVKVKKITKTTGSDKDLANLNYYYNSMNIARNKKDFLRFGDIFCLLNNTNNLTDEFILCITAHCDCLYPGKIKNLFYFVKGSKCSIADALKDGDTGFISYMKTPAGDPFCVQWKDKPFTIHLTDSKILENDSPISIESVTKNIRYMSTIKENYAQRIANKAFTYPLHVGIYYADKKPKV